MFHKNPELNHAASSNESWGDMDFSGAIGISVVGRCSRTAAKSQSAISVRMLVPRQSFSANDVSIPMFGCRSRSEEHTSELQSLMRTSYAVFCLKKKKEHNCMRKNKTSTSTH